MKGCAHYIKSGFFHILQNEGNVFHNSIMLIHSFRTVDETGYLLLVIVEKGEQGITKC